MVISSMDTDKVVNTAAGYAIVFGVVVSLLVYTMCYIDPNGGNWYIVYLAFYVLHTMHTFMQPMFTHPDYHMRIGAYYMACTFNCLFGTLNLLVIQ